VASDSGDGAAQGKQLGRTMRLVGTVSNVVGAVVVFALLAGLATDDGLASTRGGELVTLFTVAIIGGTIGADTFLTWFATPAVRALREGQPLVGRARTRLFAIPWACAGVSSITWVLSGIAFSIHSMVRLRNDFGEAAALGLVIALGGLTTGSILYLVLERRLRPMFALAFAHQEPERVQGIAVLPRLVLGWMLGSGIPLVIAAIIVLDPEADAGQIQRQTIPWLILGATVGIVVTTRMARSLAEPLTSLREAVTQVRNGRLDTRTAVDDATELGLLQAGFNEMMAGLEERQVLRDLFGRHVGQEVARRALADGVALGGEQVEATVLFVDVVGSTRLAMQLDPAAVVQMLNDFFDVVVRTVEEAQGWVNKFEGDAALCVFGPPEGHADHADRALGAARAMRAALDKLRFVHPSLDAGIGVSSGLVVAGNIGAAHRYEYTVIGDPVNEAARLAEVAKLKRARVVASGETTRRAANGEVTSWRRDGHEKLRGRADATALWVPRPRR
jgi:adenylate cyclase